MNRNHVALYTDASCYPATGTGGFSAIIRSGRNHNKEIAGTIPHASVNRAELTAVIKGLAHVEANSYVTIFTDSAYVERAVNEGRLAMWQSNGWRRLKTGEPVKNADLWKALCETIEARNISVRFRKLAAHKGHFFNERADWLAKKAAKAV